MTTGPWATAFTVSYIDFLIGMRQGTGAVAPLRKAIRAVLHSSVRSRTRFEKIPQRRNQDSTQFPACMRLILQPCNLAFIIHR